jgi:hypothetical protein
LILVYIVYLHANPDKNRRRYGFIKLNRRHLSKINTFATRKVSSTIVVKDLLRQRIGGATFIERNSVTTLQPKKTPKVKCYCIILIAEKITKYTIYTKIKDDQKFVPKGQS